jgi:hypothetical protein
MTRTHLPNRRAAKQQFRLALRVEGNLWNAYFAAPDTMRDAMLLGSIHVAIVEDPDIKRQFIELMQAALELATEEVLGIKIAAWNEPQAAPENERAGLA